MSDDNGGPSVLRLASLPRAAPHAVDWRPGAAALPALAASAGARALRKVRLHGTLIPEGRADWRLEARLGATAVQACVATTEDVTTRIEANVLRLYREEVGAAFEAPEAEMAQDADRIEPLPRAVDLADLVAEALAIEMPDYPRAAGAEPVAARAAPPGAEPLTDAAARPFAGLAGMRDAMRGEEPDGEPDDD